MNYLDLSKNELLDELENKSKAIVKLGKQCIDPPEFCRCH